MSDLSTSPSAPQPGGSTATAERREDLTKLNQVMAIMEPMAPDGRARLLAFLEKAWPTVSAQATAPRAAKK